MLIHLLAALRGFQLGMPIVSQILLVQAALTSANQAFAGTISWAPCPDNNSTQCGTLDVPMDYTNENDNKTVSIFLRKYPATVPAEQRLGSLLVNPGGPGGSGSVSVATDHQRLSKMVDGRYDIVGFDPRAVNLTNPPTGCYHTEAQFYQLYYQIEMHGVPLLSMGEAGERAHVAKLAAIQSAHNAACEQNGNLDMLRNSGTVAVAKDMERIVQALGEDGLNFLGYSYGTALGMVFASIRPNLVKRMVLDAVFDAEAYFNDVSEWGLSSVRDTDKTWAGFISTCIDAGPAHCVLASTKDNKTENVQGLNKRIDALYRRLAERPLVIADSSAGPGIIETHLVQSLIFGYMYSPRSWSTLAQILALLEQENVKNLSPFLYGSYNQITPEPYYQNVFNRSMQRANGPTREAQYPSLCSDSPQLNLTIDDYVNYIHSMRNLSPLSGKFAWITGGCRGWSFRATESYTGPWTVEQGLQKTRFPILFVSTDADPATPLASAVKMSRGFGLESASLLIQRGFGHCSYANPSLCTAKNIRDYFVDGKVPKNGTYCTSEPGWIYPTNSTKLKRSMMDKRDDELLSAIEGLGEASVKFL